MGWLVSGLLLRAYNITHQQRYLVCYCVGNSLFVSSSISPRIAVTVTRCVSAKETLSRGVVGMGWWVSELLAGAYNTNHQKHLVEPCASAPKSCATVVGCVHGGMWYKYIN